MSIAHQIERIICFCHAAWFNTGDWLTYPPWRHLNVVFTLLQELFTLSFFGNPHLCHCAIVLYLQWKSSFGCHWDFCEPSIILPSELRLWSVWFGDCPFLQILLSCPRQCTVLSSLLSSLLATYLNFSLSASFQACTQISVKLLY